MKKKKYQKPQMTVFVLEVKGALCTLSQDDWADTNVRNDINEDGKEEINWDQKW